MGRVSRAQASKRGTPSKGPNAPRRRRNLPPTNTRKKGRFRRANEQVGLGHIVPEYQLGTSVIWDSRTEFGKLKGMVVAHKVRFPGTPSMTDVRCIVALEASPFATFDEIWVSESSKFLKVDKSY